MKARKVEISCASGEGDFKTMSGDSMLSTWQVGQPAGFAELTTVRKEVYKETGVDTNEADAGLRHIVERIRGTWPKSGLGRVALDIGYFANVVDFGGVGVAMCTDGVGSKSVVAHQMGKYDTIGIDCVAMNVNDLICVGARPLSLVDYIAVETADAAMLDAIAVGLCAGAEKAGISISGGETAQLKGIVQGFDLVGTAVGRIDFGSVMSGQNVAEGDIVVGVRSNGVHSNGLSLARKAFFKDHQFEFEQRFADLDLTLGEELLRPTDIYVPEAMDVLDRVPGTKALINITSDGLLNLTRVSAEVGFVIDQLIEPQPIFALIQHYGGVSDAEMFEVFNMGVGFCYVVAPADVAATLEILKMHGRDAQIIGRATADPDRKVHIPQRGLAGRNKVFWEESSARRRAG
jgi:phosphoribosylformylglycinamidine cyclo-ligase